jgi:hypothetical protein
MITCKFSGALGNNLFTLATLISKALDNKFDFCIPNIRDCYVCDIHGNEVEVFDMFEYNFQIYDFQPLTTYTSPDILPIPDFKYTPFNIQDNTLITGYFQSEKYFIKYKNKILNEYFKPKKEILNYINQKYPWLNQYNCLSIHVRVGGDRVWMQDKFINTSIQYYEKAINTILQKDPNIEKYVIVSDNIHYCKNIFGDDKNIIYIEDEKNYIDLFLMTKCNHNIIANSTFSWWAAYLNPNPNKIVIAPKSEWFGPTLKHLNIDDLFPNDWILF